MLTVLVSKLRRVVALRLKDDLLYLHIHMVP